MQCILTSQYDSLHYTAPLVECMYKHVTSISTDPVFCMKAVLYQSLLGLAYLTPELFIP